MKLLMNRLKELIRKGKSINTLLASVFGLVGFYLLKNVLTPLLLAGKEYAGRNYLIKISLFLFYFLVFFILYFIIRWLYKRIKSRINPISSIEPNSDQKEKTFSPISKALITLALGVLLIFVINNVISRIDTEGWRLKGLDIIPVMEPIGNDFREGLYLPAKNLVKNGFAGISPDGSYPSLYPPLVNVLSLPYLLFDTQTAYLINTVLITVLNFLVLLIGTLLVNDLLLVKIIADRFTRTVLSILILMIFAFYNFSSYAFLFSIERGNVDSIAIFFSMLSIWFLIKQPKKIWLQVIFLSIATHYKIYPAVLFLVLLYCHGKKLILPALVVNFAFLLVLGPKTAWAFITSITSVANSAELGYHWSWIGNHGAYSFAQSLTNVVPKFSSFFNGLLIASTLVPFLIWALGLTKILRHKYSPMNALYLVMISIPLMDLLPTISNDYKLIIESTTFLLFISLIVFRKLHDQEAPSTSLLVIVLIIMFFIAKPYDRSFQYDFGIENTISFFLNNKYIWLLALEGTIVWNIAKQFPQTKEIVG
jgi:hypothetical protein